MDRPPDELRRATTLCYLEDLDALELDDESIHHLAVLRVAAGEPVAVSDGAGRWRPCVVTAAGTSAGRRRAGARSYRLEATGDVSSVEQAAPALTVAFAMAKGERTDLVVQKLTELGVDRIWPLLTDRTVVRLDPAEASRRADRLRRIAREAAAQSRRVHLPEIGEPGSFAGALARLAPDAARLAEPGGGPLGTGTTALVVGPEGGWSDRELGCGLGLAALGPTVLRAETAAIAGGALLAALRAGLVHVP